VVPITIQPEAPPLRMDDTGTIRVGGTRVTLDTIVQAYHDGATAEQIVQDFDSVSLEHAYAAISYYLAHRGEVDGYLTERNRQAAQLREQLEKAPSSLPDIRARLLSARKK
jgi:uncharacterized protein (DUF433 family)